MKLNKKQKRTSNPKQNGETKVRKVKLRKEEIPFYISSFYKDIEEALGLFRAKKIAVIKTGMASKTVFGIVIDKSDYEAANKALQDAIVPTPTAVVFHTQWLDQCEAAMKFLAQKKIASEQHYLDNFGRALTTKRRSAERARKLLATYKGEGEVVKEEESLYYFCAHCEKLINPASQRCRYCRVYVGDAHGS